MSWSSCSCSNSRKWLKSVHVFGSYHKIKIWVPYHFFGPLRRYHNHLSKMSFFICPKSSIFFQNSVQIWNFSSKFTPATERYLVHKQTKKYRFSNLCKEILNVYNNVDLFHWVKCCVNVMWLLMGVVIVVMLLIVPSLVLFTYIYSLYTQRSWFNDLILII